MNKFEELFEEAVKDALISYDSEAHREVLIAIKKEEFDKWLLLRYPDKINESNYESFYTYKIFKSFLLNPDNLSPTEALNEGIKKRDEKLSSTVNNDDELIDLLLKKLYIAPSPIEFKYLFIGLKAGYIPQENKIQNDRIILKMHHENLFFYVDIVKGTAKISATGIKIYESGNWLKHLQIQKDELHKIEKRDKLMFDVNVSMLQTNLNQRIGLKISIGIGAVTLLVLAIQVCIQYLQGKEQQRLLQIQSQPSPQKIESHDVYNMYGDSLQNSLNHKISPNTPDTNGTK